MRGLEFFGSDIGIHLGLFEFWCLGFSVCGMCVRRFALTD